MSEHDHASDCGCGHDHPAGDSAHHHGRGFGRPKFGGCGHGPGAHRHHHGHGSSGAGWGGPGGRGSAGFGPGGFHKRAKRGAVRFGILMLLAEGPKHGYQLIQELGEKSGGMWQPSPGSVYPALEKLEEHGMVTSTEEGDKKVYALTDAGREKVARFKEQAPPWAMSQEIPSGVVDLRDAMAQLASAAMQVAKTGTDEQRARAVEIVTSARKGLYGILAED